MKFIREIFFFGISGVLGFLADVTVLYILKDCFGLFFARLFSFLAAVFVTWTFNRLFTFVRKRSGLKRMREFLAYLMLMLVGGGINYGIYVWLVVTSELVASQPVIGVAAGSLVGMFANLATSRYLLFRMPDHS